MLLLFHALTLDQKDDLLKARVLDKQLDLSRELTRV